MNRTSLFIPGQSIGGRFRVERFLGRGGAGNVLAAHDDFTGKRVALKLLRSAAAVDAILVERFRREATALDGIDHPGVIGVEDAGVLDDGTLFLAMELLEGLTLAQRIARQGPMSADELAPVLAGLCDALGAIHRRGILHRDIKPSNIFLPDPAVSSDVVKVVDFGVVKIDGLEGLTREAVSVGTSAYMAPEQLRGRGAALDVRVDVYAAGVTAYEALSGKRPFMTSQDLHVYEAILAGRYPSLIEAAPSVTPAVVRTVERAFAKDAASRFRDAGAFGAAFTAAAGR